LAKIKEQLLEKSTSITKRIKKNRGLKSMFVIRDTLNGNNLDEVFHYNPTPGEIAKFKYAKITSYDGT